MSGRLTPFGVVCKWVLAPIALGLAGYFLIGPRIGKGVLDRVQVPEHVRSMLSPEEQKPKGPSVEIDSKPVR